MTGPPESTVPSGVRMMAPSSRRTVSWSTVHGARPLMRNGSVEAAVRSTEVVGKAEELKVKSVTPSMLVEPTSSAPKGVSTAARLTRLP